MVQRSTTKSDMQKNNIFLKSYVKKVIVFNNYAEIKKSNTRSEKIVSISFKINAKYKILSISFSLNIHIFTLSQKHPENRLVTYVILIQNL